VEICNHHAEMLQYRQGLFVKNKTGTSGSEVLYVDNRWIVGLRHRGAYRVDPNIISWGYPRQMPELEPMAEDPGGAVIFWSGERRWLEA
jgi:hypothetical protein